MTLQKAFAFLLVASLLCSCSSYLVSPLAANSHPYIPYPKKNTGEPAKMERYATLSASVGSPLQNHGYDDWTFYLGTSLAQTHAFGKFRANYAVDLMAGTFRLATENETDAGTSAEKQYRLDNGGALFSGFVGTHGSICFAQPIKSGRFEWRVLGLEGSLAREFGAYKKFRSQIPNELYGNVETRDWVYSAGIFSEFVRYLKKEKSFGMKFAVSAVSLASIASAPFGGKVRFGGVTGLPHYFSVTPFLSIRKFSGFCQVNVATGISTFQVGAFFKLGKSRAADPLPATLN